MHSFSEYMITTFRRFIVLTRALIFITRPIQFSGDGNDMNPALPDTSMKLGRYVYKHELFEIFSLANQNYSNFQDGDSKFQDGCQNKYQIRKWCSSQ